MVLYAYPQACPDRFSIRFAAAEPDDRTRTATCRARPAPAGWVRPPPERLRPRGSGSHPKAEGYFCEKAFNFITKVTIFFGLSYYLFISAGARILPLSKMQASRFSFLAYSYFGFAQDTLARQNASKQVFVLDLFVSLASPKILSLGKMQASLLLPSLIRIFDSVLDTFASAMLK